MEPWKQKANDIISKLSLEAYIKANTRKDGKRYKKHVPYTIPQTAQDLVECLGTNDEIRAKDIFIRLAYLNEGETL